MTSRKNSKTSGLLHLFRNADRQLLQGSLAMFHSLYHYSSRCRKSRRFVNRIPATRRLIAERLEDRCLLTGLVFDSVILANSDTVGAYSSATAADSAGNTYMCGNFAGVMDFDRNVSHAGNADILTARGNSDAFVAKYGAQGQFLWARRMGGDSTNMLDDVYSVAIDNTDNVYVSGKFAQSADFGAVTLNSAGSYDAFVAKLDSNGSFQWVKGWGTEFGDHVTDLVVDQSGKATAVGYTLTGSRKNIELRQFDANGNSTWTGQFAPGDHASALSVNRGADGSLYVSGNFTGTVDLDPGPGEYWVTGSSIPDYAFVNNAFVLKLTGDGQLQWAAPLLADNSQDPSSSIKILDMEIGNDGSIALLGNYEGQVDVDPSSGIFPLPNSQTAGTYFARLSTSGALVTATTYNGIFGFYNLAAVSGGFAIAIEFNSTPFNPVPGISFTDKGGGDIAIMAVTDDGAVVWAGQVGGVGSEYLMEMVSNGSGGVLVTGYAGKPSSDYDPDPNRTYTVNNPAWADAFVLKLKPLGDTKYYVVDDATQNLTYEYNVSGGLVESYGLNSGNTAPRGAASTIVGDRTWVVDANRKVYVYDTSGALLGSWTAGTLSSTATVEGIATNGTDVWIVDAKSDKVYKYAGAATRLSGSQNATSNFSLNSSNTSPKDIVTDGVSLWVVNDSTTDKVFKYTVAGGLSGSWTISSANSKPTGLTIDPANVSNIWIVDSGTDTVYQYTAAASRISGSQSAAATFALAAGNNNPQGIADPPPMSFSGRGEGTGVQSGPQSNEPFGSRTVNGVAVISREQIVRAAVSTVTNLSKPPRDASVDAFQRSSLTAHTHDRTILGSRVGVGELSARRVSANARLSSATFRRSSRESTQTQFSSSSDSSTATEVLTLIDELFAETATTGLESAI